jgi:hypothetical protein
VGQTPTKAAVLERSSRTRALGDYNGSASMTLKSDLRVDVLARGPFADGDHAASSVRRAAFKSGHRSGSTVSSYPSSAASHVYRNEASKDTAVAAVASAIRLPTVIACYDPWYRLTGSTTVVTGGNEGLGRIRL